MTALRGAGAPAVYQDARVTAALCGHKQDTSATASCKSPKRLLVLIECNIIGTTEGLTRQHLAVAIIIRNLPWRDVKARYEPLSERGVVAFEGHHIEPSRRLAGGPS